MQYAVTEDGEVLCMPPLAETTQVTLSWDVGEPFVRFERSGADSAMKFITSLFKGEPEVVVALVRDGNRFTFLLKNASKRTLNVPSRRIVMSCLMNCSYRIQAETAV